MPAFTDHLLTGHHATDEPAGIVAAMVTLVAVESADAVPGGASWILGLRDPHLLEAFWPIQMEPGTASHRS
jgi:hypothetical protein